MSFSFFSKEMVQRTHFSWNQWLKITYLFCLVEVFHWPTDFIGQVCVCIQEIWLLFKCCIQSTCTGKKTIRTIVQTFKQYIYTEWWGNKQYIQSHLQCVLTLTASAERPCWHAFAWIFWTWMLCFGGWLAVSLQFVSPSWSSCLHFFIFALFKSQFVKVNRGDGMKKWDTAGWFKKEGEEEKFTTKQ